MVLKICTTGSPPSNATLTSSPELASSACMLERSTGDDPYFDIKSINLAAPIF